MQPWEMDPAPSFPTLYITSSIHIEKHWPTKGAAIVLSGSWWKGQVSVNGTALPVFYGGAQDVEVPLTGLQSGPNTLSIKLEVPEGVSRRVTGGTLSSLDRKGSSAYLASAPVVILRPESHIAGMTVLTTPDQIVPKVWITGNAQSVQLSIHKDGQKLVDFAPCPINDGVVNCSPIEWPLEWWSMGNPNLYFLQAVLKDSNETVIDSTSERIGVRSVDWATRGALKINGENVRLMAARMVHRHRGQSFQERIVQFTKAGVNSVESHGEWIRQDWLELADEMGLATIIVPRCVGRTNDRQGGSEDHLSAHMTLQDQRLLWDIKNHPTVVGFALEGDTSNHWSNRSLWTDTLLNNPQNLPVFGKDQPVRLFQVEYLPDGSVQSTCRPQNCEGSWLVETVTQPKFVDWASVANAYANAHKDGALGGVIPTPRQSGGINKPDNKEETNDWISAWKTASEIVQPTSSPKNTRASSDIQIKTSPNQWVELQISGQVTQRSISDDTGTVQFWVYHDGSAQLSCGPNNKEITIIADQWVNAAHKSNNPPIQCP